MEFQLVVHARPGERDLCQHLIHVIKTFPASYVPELPTLSEAEGQDPVEVLSDDCYGTALGSEDFRKWAQADPRWGSIELSTSGKTVAKIGCLVTSITKLIIKRKL